MDYTLLSEAQTAIKDAAECLERLTTSEKKLKTHFSTLRETFERHLASMEHQTVSKLDKMIKDQTQNVKKAEKDLKERMKMPGEKGALKAALKQLRDVSNILDIEFEISPDLDRLRFLSEFGIIRRSADRRYTDKDTASLFPVNSMSLEDEQISSVDYNSTSSTDSCHSSKGLDDTGALSEISSAYGCVRGCQTDANNASIASGFLYVSSNFPKEKDKSATTPICGAVEFLQHTDSSGISESTTADHSLGVTEIHNENIPKEREQFITMEDGRIIAYSKSNEYVKLLSQECRILDELKVNYPKAVCCLKRESILIVVETSSHDEIWVVKVTSNKLVKVDVIRLKCHDRIRDIVYQGTYIYVTCAGNHLHLLDT